MLCHVVWNWTTREQTLEVGVSFSPDSDLQSDCNVSSGKRAGASGCRGWRGNGLCFSLSSSQCLSALFAEHVLQLVSNKTEFNKDSRVFDDTQELFNR